MLTKTLLFLNFSVGKKVYTGTLTPTPQLETALPLNIGEKVLPNIFVLGYPFFGWVETGDTFYGGSSISYVS